MNPKPGSAARGSKPASSALPSFDASASPFPSSAQMPRSQLTLYVVALVSIAFFLLLSMTSVSSISRLTSARKVHPTWLDPSHPSHRSPFFNGAYSSDDTANNASAQHQQSFRQDTFDPAAYRPPNYAGPFLTPPDTKVVAVPPPMQVKCLNAAIVTIGYYIPNVVDQLANLTDWCIIIVPTPVTSNETEQALRNATDRNIIFLGEETVYKLPYTTAQNLRSKSELGALNRGATLIDVNNIAYLLAAHQGAENILDIWYDVAIDTPDAIPALLETVQHNAFPLADANYQLFNPHPFFRPVSAVSTHEQPHSWPRGFPLRQVPYPPTRVANTSTATLSPNKLAVVGALLNFQADVDATLATTTDQLPLVFQKRRARLALPATRFAPLSSAFLLWRKASFATLFLPPRIPVRIVDVLRGYLAQRALHAAGLHVGFVSPVGRREAGAVVTWGGGEVEYDAHVSPVFDGIVFMMRAWQMREEKEGKGTSLAGVVHQLLVTLMQMQIVQTEDVVAATVWLEDLRKVLPDHEMFTKVLSTAVVPLPLVAEVTDAAGSAAGAGGAMMMSQRVGDARRVPHVAVCVTGRVDALTETVSAGRVAQAEDNGLDTIKYSQQSLLRGSNVTVGASIYETILKRLVAPDLFIVSRDTGRKAGGEQKEGGDADDAKLCDALQMAGGKAPFRMPCMVRTEDDASGVGRGNRTAWGKLMVRWWAGSAGADGSAARGVKGLLQHLRQLEVCHEAIGKHTAKSGKAYDWVVSVRGDAHAVLFPPLEMLTLREEGPTVWVGAKDACCCGDVGGVAVGNARVMQIYLQQYAYLHGVLQAVGSGAAGRKVVSEFESMLLTSRGIAVKVHPDIGVCSEADRR